MRRAFSLCFPGKRRLAADGEIDDMPSIPAPKPHWQRVLGTTFLYDVLIALTALANALLTLKRGNLALILAAFLVMLFAVIKAAIQWRQKDAQDSPHELEGCLYTLYDILRLSVPADQPDPGLRITVHVPSGDGKNLIQVINYVGSQRKVNAVGRLTPISCGITGRAYRTKEPADLQRASDNTEEYIRILVVSQGFTEAQARSVDHSTMSGYAAPLLSADGSVAGIVYADAISPDFFNEEHVGIINRACVGIARFIERKYAV
jgi:hypothetical protein